MIDTRFLGYMALAFIALLIYQAWVQDYGPKSAPAELEFNADSVQPSAADLPGNLLENEPPAVTSTAPDPEQRALIQVKTDVLQVAIDPVGGSVVQAQLLQYPVSLDEPSIPVELLSTPSKYYVAQSGLLSRQNNAPNHHAQYRSPQQEYILADGAEQVTVPLHWQDPTGVMVTKTLVFTRGKYVIDVHYHVDNQSNQAWQGGAYYQLQHSQAESRKNRLIYTYTGGVIYSPENKYEKIDFEEMAKKPLNRRFADGWAAMIQHYFLSAWLPQPEISHQYYSQGVNSIAGPRYVLGFNTPMQAAAPNDKTEFHSRLYLGPKLQDDLKQLAKGLELTVDYGLLTVIAQPLFWLLNKIYSYIGNWGWAIVLLTLLIKLVFYKLAETSYRSMAQMRKVQPKMLQIRERYANDKQRQSQALMDLYKQEKINPLGGCLPVLIQIPVFIALYWVLLESVEIRQAPFMLWIQDLSSKDPYFVLPIIMGVSMYVQQKLNPAPVDPIQAKVFMLLPFIFTVFFAFFPAGLVLYWVVNNLTTIAQQWVINKRVLNEK